MNTRNLNKLLYLPALLAIVATLLLTPTQTTYAAPTATACVDFEDLNNGDTYINSDTFTDSGVPLKVVDFQWSNGTWTPDGSVNIGNSGIAGGTGLEANLNNANLSFDFSASPSMDFHFLFGEYGGNLNIEINGDFQNFDNFQDIDGAVIGGTNVSVVNGFGNDQGSVSISGVVNHLMVGGQELWIDASCQATQPNECIHFNDVGLGNMYGVGDSFVSVGATFTGIPFVWASGTSTSSGFAEIDPAGNSGGSVHEVETNNINLESTLRPDFSNGFEMRFGEYGGNINFSINGDFHNVDNYQDLDGLVVGGSLITILAGGFGNDNGLLRAESLGAPVNSIVTGGQEHFIDDICPIEPTQQDDSGDLGDAPDSSNHSGAAMTAYPGIPARFPTVYDPAAPHGPIHRFPFQRYWLGNDVSREHDADLLPDADGTTNIDPPANAPDRDRHDDGVVFPDFVACEPVNVEFKVTVPAGAPDSEAYVNMWFDWDHSGRWGETLSCPGIAIEEWAVQDMLIALPGPGTYTFMTPTFMPPSIIGQFNDTWARVTLSEAPAPGASGRGPAAGYGYGETEDYYLDLTTDPDPEPMHDLGDAPDSSNHFGVDMMAYAGIVGKFPTVFDPAAPHGPLHHAPRAAFYLGQGVTLEDEADMGLDEDPTNNLVIGAAGIMPDMDLMDDGLRLPFMNPCEPTRAAVQVTVPPTGSGGLAYLNLWFDFNRSGEWGEIMDCPQWLSDEWAVQNHSIMLPGPGTYNIVTPPFLPPFDFSQSEDMWVRVTLSEQPAPASARDGSGPTSGYELGETEDHLVIGEEEPCVVYEMGRIEGHVFDDATGAPLGNMNVSALEFDGMSWVVAGADTTNPGGNYSIDLAPGVYRIVITDPSGTFMTEYYDDVTALTDAADLGVTMCQTIELEHGLALEEEVEPPFKIIDGEAQMVFNAATGEWVIMVNRNWVGDVGICMTIVCPDGSTPTNVMFWVDGTPYPMTQDATDPTQWLVSVPSSALSAGATIMITYDCDSGSQSVPGGGVELFDPSGDITDADTGLPVVGATVTLYYVPGWRPAVGPGDVGSNVCESNLSKPAGTDWSQPAPTNLGILLAPDLGLMSPGANTQQTNSVGRYAWDVAEGCWYVTVEADGYETKVSPVVGVPPEVTDLDLELTPLTTPTAVAMNGQAMALTSQVTALIAVAFIGLVSLTARLGTKRD